MLKTPMTEDKIPPAMTTRQRGSPRLSTLVATLFRLPRVLKPIIIIVRPRKVNPDSSLSTGHFFAKYDLRRVSSDTIRKMLMALVMKWEVASKKKTRSGQ
jgi:hypothetical protein